MHSYVLIYEVLIVLPTLSCVVFEYIYYLFMYRTYVQNSKVYNNVPYS